MSNADSKQYHLYFYTTECQILSWLKLLHETPPKVESEVNSGLSLSIGNEIFTSNFVFSIINQKRSNQRKRTKLIKLI